MTTIISLIEKTSRKKPLLLLLAALIVFNVLMNAPGLPGSTPSMQKVDPSFTPFDLQYKGYSSESFTADLGRLGSRGRETYRNFMIEDIFFPAIYALTFSSLIFLVFRSRKNWLKWLYIIPLVTGLTDYIENVFIAIAFSGFPSPSPAAVYLASFATQTKMLFNALLIVALLITLVTWLTTLFKKSK